MKVYIENYGCISNLCDAKKMENLLKKAGFTIVDRFEQADAAVINTCTVTKFTERKMLKRIKNLSSKKLIVAGCLPAAQPELLAHYNVETLTPSNLHEICEKLGSKIAAEDRTPPSGITGAIGYISICEGCLGACSYCIVKKARGKLRSYNPDAIEAQVKILVEQGAREIQITAQDTSSYGIDLNTNLAALIKKISKIKGDFMIRVGMMNPATAKPIIEELLDAFASPKVFKFLHLPVQSGSNRILELMNRGYRIEDYCEIVHAFRARYPELLLSTDYIVGFPGESKEDFELTKKNLLEIKPVKVNITRFSPRPHTLAYEMPDMLERLKKQRSRILTQLHHQITSEYYRSIIGKQLKVLTTERGKQNTTIARDNCYRNIVIKENLPLGKWFDVKVIDSSITYAIAKQSI
ncbi:MAG: tRNA (N(6)-L-threonylcarbamoyladenosine(37)-C(2))-methylthiotransferase [Methanocellales archaeon]